MQIYDEVNRAAAHPTTGPQAAALMVDGLVDTLTDLSSNGVVWLLTPKVGRGGHVEPADVQEAAITAGLAQTTTTASLSQDWTATKLVRPKGNRR